MTQMNRRPMYGTRNVPRRPLPRRTGIFSDAGLISLVIIGLVVVVLAFFMQKAAPDGFALVAKKQGANQSVRTISEIHSDGPLRINEIMTSNKGALVLGNAESPDWVELVNVSKAAVNLEGWSLAKNERNSNVLRFPRKVLEPNECVLICADGILRADEGQLLHAPFRLSSAGDTLMLFNASGAAVDSVNIPPLGANQAYVRADVARWQISSSPTPGLVNSQESYAILALPDPNTPIIITEVMPGNRSAYADDQGRFYDYIELYNCSNEELNLEGWGLSDDAAKPHKWSFPSVTIAPKKYLVVFTTGSETVTSDTQLYASIGLNSEGEQVVLTNAEGKRMDIIDYGFMKADTAYTRNGDDTWATTTIARAGRANQ